MNTPARTKLSTDYMRALAAVESGFPVLDWRIGEIPVWPLLRVRWMFAEWVRSGDRRDNPSVARVGALSRLWKTGRGALASLADAVTYPRGRDHSAEQRDLLFMSDGISLSSISGCWVERFCDPLIDASKRLGMKSALWMPLRMLPRPRRTPTRQVQGGIDMATLRAVANPQFTVGDSVLPGHEEVLQLLAARGFGVESLSLRAVLSDANRLRLVANTFKRGLARVRPRLAFIVSYYGLEGFAFVLACRESGVPVVELQHGVQGENHPAYAAWPPPRDGLHPLLPDCFWVWSSWEKGVIDGWSSGSRHCARVAGNPWVAVWCEQSGWPGVDAALRAAAQLKARAGAKPVVLVTLQYGMSPSVQLKPLARFIRHASGRFTFWVRLHPLMESERGLVLEVLRGAGEFAIDEPTELPLLALLRHANLHLTHSSSAVIEAAQFGVRSILTSEWGAELFGPFLESGLAVTCTGSVEELEGTCVSLLANRGSAELAMPDLDNGLRQLLEEYGRSR